MNPELKFKIKRYNLGGYLDFGGSLGNMDEEYFSDPTVQKNMRSQADSSRLASGVSSAVAFIPGVGTAISAGLKFGQAIGSATKDQYGIYKSKGAEILDDTIDPTRWADLISGSGASQGTL